MPKAGGPHWHAAGGYTFAPDPDAIAGSEQPIYWLPERSPTVLLLTEAPPGFGTTKAFDRILLIPLSAAHRGDIRQPYSIDDPEGPLHIASADDKALHRPAVIVPLDAAIDLRLAVLQRLVRRLHGDFAGPIPTSLRLTALQKSRLIQLLQTYDIHAEGGGPRDVAAKVLRSEQAGLRSVEWKDSAARRKAIRLHRDADALVNGGYLKLLNGA